MNTRRKFILRLLTISFLMFVSVAVLVAQQCAAITKKGTQCKRKAQAGSLYCWQHRPMYETKSEPKANTQQTTEKTRKAIPGKTEKVEKQTTKDESYSGQCQAITKKGTRCSRKAQPGSKYCWQHNK